MTDTTDAIPAGDGVMVPREPTEAMITAGIGEWLGHGMKALTEEWRKYVTKTYRAMLAAAPSSPPSIDAAAVERAIALVHRIATREPWQDHYGQTWEEEAGEIVAALTKAAAHARS